MARPFSQHVSVGGHSSKHNLDNKYRATLEHIDKEMCDLNVTLRSDGLRGVYTELFGQAVENYNAKQKRKDRRIKDYYEQVRDDARGHKGVQNKDGKRLAYEQVVGIGNRETFSPSDLANRELARAVYTDYVAEFERRYPNLRVFEAVIHMDEPEGGIHLHLAYVPWGEGYKRGLERQQSLSKACENMGFSHMELDSKCRQMLEEVCRRHDIERVDMGNHEHHKPTPQYKREQRDLERIQAQKETAREELRHVQAEVKAAKRECEKAKTGAHALKSANKRTAAQAKINQEKAREARQEAQKAIAEREEVLAQVETLTQAKNALVGECERLMGMRDRVKDERDVYTQQRDDAANDLAEIVATQAESAIAIEAQARTMERNAAVLDSQRAEMRGNAEQITEQREVLQQFAERVYTLMENIKQHAKEWLTEPYAKFRQFAQAHGEKAAREKVIAQQQAFERAYNSILKDGQKYEEAWKEQREIGAERPSHRERMKLDRDIKKAEAMLADVAPSYFDAKSQFAEAEAAREAAYHARDGASIFARLGVNREVDRAEAAYDAAKKRFEAIKPEYDRRFEAAEALRAEIRKDGLAEVAYIREGAVMDRARRDVSKQLDALSPEARAKVMAALKERTPQFARELEEFRRQPERTQARTRPDRGLER